MALTESCKVVFEDSRNAWIVLSNRGGKVKEACEEFGKAVKKKDAKNYDKLRKALKDAIDSARDGWKDAKEAIEKGDGIMHILEQKYTKDAVEKDDQCKKAVDQLKEAHDFDKDIKPILDKAQKMYDTLKL